MKQLPRPPSDTELDLLGGSDEKDGTVSAKDDEDKDKDKDKDKEYADYDEDDDDDDDDDDDERPSVGCAEGLTVRMATFRSQSMMNPRGSESDSLRK